MSETMTGDEAFAGFWRRFAAWVLDHFVIGIGCFVFAFVLSFCVAFLGAVSGAWPPAAGREAIEWATRLIGYVAPLAYYPLFEGGPWQATPGKRALRIYVCDDEGRRITRSRALGRLLATILTWLTLGIGFLPCAWTERSRALQDMVSGTTVVRGRP